MITDSNVADPHHIDAACHFGADPDPACHFDPDPTFHFDPNPDPSFQIKSQNLEKVLKIDSYSIHFGFSSAN